MDNYLWLKPSLIEYKEILFLLCRGAGEQGAREKGERIIVNRKNYLSYQKKCTLIINYSVKQYISNSKMHENKLFQRTRLSLASWYVMVMGIILSICTLGFYEAILHAHRITILRELKSVAKTIHDSLKVVLKQPSKLTATATRILPDLCLVETSCAPIQSHFTRVPETGNYYLRLLDRSIQQFNSNSWVTTKETTTDSNSSITTTNPNFQW